jgi:hypothetical protein
MYQMRPNVAMMEVGIAAAISVDRRLLGTTARRAAGSIHDQVLFDVADGGLGKSDVSPDSPHGPPGGSAQILEPILHGLDHFEGVRARLPAPAAGRARAFTLAALRARPRRLPHERRQPPTEFPSFHE